MEENGVRLLSSLDDDAAAVPDLDAQVVVVEHPHTYEGQVSDRWA